MNGYDYTLPGAYFVTVCAHSRQQLFGELRDGEIRLNDSGQLVARCWLDIPRHFARVGLDEFVVMPDHLHGVVVIHPSEATERAELPCESSVAGLAALSVGSSPRPVGSTPNSLAAIIQNFKCVSSRRINQVAPARGGSIWQRGYYEHVLRSEKSLEAVRQYIRDNPGSKVKGSIPDLNESGASPHAHGGEAPRKGCWGKS